MSVPAVSPNAFPSLPYTGTASTDSLTPAQLSTLMTALGSLSLQKEGSNSPDQVQIAHFLLVQNGMLPKLSAGQEYTKDFKQIEGALLAFQGGAHLGTDMQAGPETWGALFGAKDGQRPKYGAAGVLDQPGPRMTLAQAQTLYAQLHPTTAAGSTPVPPAQTVTGFQSGATITPTPPPGQASSPPVVAAMGTIPASRLQSMTTIPMALSPDFMAALTKELGAPAAQALNTAVATDAEARRNLIAWIDPSNKRPLTFGKGPIEAAATMVGPGGAALQLGSAPDPKQVIAALKSLGNTPNTTAPKDVSITYFPPIQDAKGKVRGEVIDALTAGMKNNAGEWVSPLIKKALADDPTANDIMAAWLKSGKSITLDSSGKALDASGKPLAPIGITQAADGSGITLTINAPARPEDFAGVLKDIGMPNAVKLDPNLRTANYVPTTNAAGKVSEAAIDKMLVGMSPGDAAWTKKILMDATRTDPEFNKLLLQWNDSDRSLTLDRVLPRPPGSPRVLQAGVQLMTNPDGKVFVAMGTGSTTNDVIAAFKKLGPPTGIAPAQQHVYSFPGALGPDGLIRGEVITGLTEGLGAEFTPNAYAALVTATRADKSFNATLAGWLDNSVAPFSVSIGKRTGITQDSATGAITLMLAPDAKAKDLSKLLQMLPTT